MVNTPFPRSLKSEAKKAAKILGEFSIPSAKTGPDRIIPASIIANAKGLAIITVVRVGFLVTARGGSGLVIAKLSDNTWSAPSAIGLAGLGGGFEIGAEVTDFVIILNSSSAVSAFSKGGNLTLGGNFSVAAGPVGRNVEADVAVRSPAAIYTYSKTKGLFVGISIEGSYLVERKEANQKFYGEGIRAADILYGKVTPPEECWALYEVLEQHGTLQQDNSDHSSSGTSSRATSSYYDNMTLNQSTSKHTKESNWFSKSSWANKASKAGSTTAKTSIKRSSSMTHISGTKFSLPPSTSFDDAHKAKADSAVGAAVKYGSSAAVNYGSEHNKQSNSDVWPNVTNAVPKNFSDYWTDPPSISMSPSSLSSANQRTNNEIKKNISMDNAGSEHRYSDRHTRTDQSGMQISYETTQNPSYEFHDAKAVSWQNDVKHKTKPASNASEVANHNYSQESQGHDNRNVINQPLWCKALYDYDAEMSCDLSFRMGDMIEVLTRTDTVDDWWEGRSSSGKVGIFPANFTQLCP